VVFLEELCFPVSCGDRTVVSAVEERRSDRTSESTVKNPWFFSRSSVSLVRVGIELHPERWSWRFRAASCSLRKTGGRDSRIVIVRGVEQPGV
jgi:hypothetical protein